MANALTKGQNGPITDTRVAVSAQVAAPCDISALLVTAAGKVRNDADFIFFNQPEGPGVHLVTGDQQRVEVDVAQVPADIEQVRIVLTLEDSATTFGSLTAPHTTVADGSGNSLYSYTIEGLSSESIVIAVELYRRQGAWKVRAVGQGYAGGFADLVTDHGVSVDDDGSAASAAPAATPHHGEPQPCPAATPPAPAAAPGPTTPPPPGGPTGPGGMPAAGPGGMPAAGPGGMPAAGPGGMPAAGPGGMPAAGPGGMPAAGPGGMPAAGPGGMPAAGPGGMPAAGPGGMPAAGPGGMPTAGPGGAHGAPTVPPLGPPAGGPTPPPAAPQSEKQLTTGRPVSLAKGERVSLSKDEGSALTRVRMGLGWDPVRKSGFFGSREIDIDLDASVILISQRQPADIVYYGQLQSKDGSIQHSGDNLTGQGEGDDEMVHVDLTRVPPYVDALAFIVTSYKGQTFDNIQNAFCRLVDDTTGSELARFTLTGGGSNTAIHMAKLFRDGNAWKMEATGKPFNARHAGEAVQRAAQIVLS